MHTVHVFLDREWDPKTKTTKYVLPFFVFPVEFCVLCKKSTRTSFKEQKNVFSKSHMDDQNSRIVY
jgi:hypothetical protein